MPNAWKKQWKIHIVLDDVFFQFGGQFGGVWGPKMGPKIKHFHRKSKKNLIFGRPFLGRQFIGVEKASWGSPGSIFGPLEVNFGGSRGPISWIFALNFC